MYVCTVTEDFKVIPFLFRPMPQPRIPNQRDYDGSTVHKIDGQGFIVEAQ